MRKRSENTNEFYATETRETEREIKVMSDTKDIRSTSRRELLKLAGLAAGVAGAAAAGGTAQASSARARAEDGGYRETDHVRKYYELAR